MSDETRNGAADEPPEVSILLVNWNTREMTLECLASIYRETTRCRFEVIVIDNGSVDGSAAAIAEQFPQVRLMAEEVNHGFGRATNIQAKEARGQRILLLNTDTVVLDHAIDNLVEFADTQPQARIWGGRTLFGDRSLNPTSCWGLLTPWNVISRAVGLKLLFSNSPLFNDREYPGWARDSVREVGIVTGCLFLVDADFWRELGGFDSRFFMYGEEVDFCYRARRAGARPMITPAATIVHYGGGSSTARAGSIVRLSAAETELIDLHFPQGTRRLSKAVFHFGFAWRALAYKLAAQLAPQRFGQSALLWSECWARRAEWRHGTKPV